MDPRWGRGLEVPSEDSFHAQSYVRNLIPGLQGGLEDLASKQMIATCKHFAVYDVETDRTGMNYDATQQDLGDYYLQPFKTCVRDVGVGSIMCSYNQINNSYACQNSHLQNYILKNELGFQGFIVSDWAAQHSGVSSALAGLDMTMPGDVTFDSTTSYWVCILGIIRS